MPRQHHELKTETKFYQAIEKGVKKFELRKNDRHFTEGDIITLKETVGQIFTGRSIGPLEIKYIFQDSEYGLKEGYCIINW